MKKRYPLDLSALAYPLMRTHSAQSNFRYTARLDRSVEPKLLLRSLEYVLPRYPSFQTRIACGPFWHTLKENVLPLIVTEDRQPPLTPMRKKETNRYPFRLTYIGDEIVLEVFHALTDGNIGGLFFADILTKYVALQEGTDILLPERNFSVEDPFRAFGKKIPFRDLSVKKYNGKSVVALGGKGNYDRYPRLISTEIDLSYIKQKAADADATLTEYVTAAYLAAIFLTQDIPLNKPLSLFIPINLRRFFPTNSLRNFVCFERITLTKGSGERTFSELLDEVKKQFCEKITLDAMQRNVNDLVTCMSLPIPKYVPLFLKSPCFRLVKKVMNKVRQTAILSNVGAITLPPEAEKHVREIRFFLNVNQNAPLNLAVLSYAGKCILNITCKLTHTEIPEIFFSILRS